MGIDILKMVCSFMVVYIHTALSGNIGEAIYMVSRIAVPIFFIITGFFYSDTVQHRKVFVQIGKIFRLFLVSNAIFFISELLFALIPEMNIKGFLTKVFDMQVIKEFLVFNVSPFSFHLWYMGAILYTLIIMAFVYKPRTKKYLWIFVPVLLIIDLLMGDYSVIVFDRTFPVYLVRNFMCVGIPYFLIGTMLREYYAIIKQKTTHIFWCWCTVFLCFLTVAERYLLVVNGIAGRRKHNISTTLLAISFFLFFLLFFDKRKHNYFTRFMETISVKYSMWIYIVHPLCITVFGKIAAMLKVSAFYSYVSCVVVYIGTVILLVFVDKFCQYIFKEHNTAT